jgi:hypothetical protein
VCGGGGSKGPLSNGIGFKRQTQRVPPKDVASTIVTCTSSVWKWELNAVFLHHQQEANHKHLSAVLVKKNMTSEEVELSLTLCVKCRSAIHPATRPISITKVSPLLYTRCLSLGHRSSPIHHPSPPLALSDLTLRLRSRMWRRVLSFQKNLYLMLILILTF